MPSDLSKVLYVELYEPGGKLLERVTVEIENGRASGNISFTEKSDKSGIYRIKSYTAWSLNFGSSYVFRKNIEVRTGEENEFTASKQELDIQFMPEGGKLVAGIPTRLAFKSIGPDGLGKDVKGVIYQEGTTDSISFSTIHLGMGFTEFTPQKGAAYKAEVNGVTYYLPEVQDLGTILSVTQSQDQFIVKVLSNDEVGTSSPLLFAHVRGEVFSAELVNMQDGNGQVFISKAQLPTGVVHFTLLNKLGLPIAERLAFNKNEVDNANVSLSLSDSEVSLRDRVDLSVRVTGQDSEEITSTSSVTIYDDSIDPFNMYRPSIVSRMYLESEIEGYIEHPGFYFSDHSQTDEYLDVLMMTQGWRAYDMSTVLDWENIELYSYAEQGFRVSGKIIAGLRRRGQDEAPVLFTMGAENKQVQVVTTDDEGNFVIDGLKVNGSETVEIKANDKKGRDNITIRMDEQFSHLPEQREEIAQVIQTLLEQEIPSVEEKEEAPIEEEVFERAVEASTEAEQFIEVMMQGELDEITVTSERIGFTEEEVNEDYATKALKQSEARGSYFDLDEKEWMRNATMPSIITQLPGVTFTIPDILTINTGTQSFNTPVEPIFLINGVFTDLDAVLSLDADDVQTIGVLRSSVDLAIYGAQGAGGAIIITLRKGARVEPAKGFVQTNLLGFQLPAQFYSPRYGVNVPSDHPTKDNRLTLHWEPEFEISGSGASFRFWANDIPSRYRVIVEGITETGVPFFQTQTFTIVE